METSLSHPPDGRPELCTLNLESQHYLFKKSRAGTPRYLSRLNLYIERGKLRLRDYIRGAAEM